MRQRLISAAVLVPAVVIVFLVGEPALSLGIFVLTLLTAYEASRLMQLAGLQAATWLAVFGAGGAVVATPFAVGRFAVPGAAIPVVVGYVAAVLVAAAVVSLTAREPRLITRRWAASALAVLYPALLAFMLAITLVAPAISPGAPLAGTLDAGRSWLLVLVLTVWSLDTFAYLTGRTFPRGRMAPRISPNKTWSGAIGGTIAAVVVCTALVSATGQHPAGGAALGALIAVTAQAGDLAESMLKRAARVKDSGNLIPGHGGILDRVDSFLFAAPAMFLALTLT